LDALRVLTCGTHDIPTLHWGTDKNFAILPKVINLKFCWEWRKYSLL